jgi:hypothetical protein
MIVRCSPPPCEIIKAEFADVLTKRGDLSRALDELGDAGKAGSPEDALKAAQKAEDVRRRLEFIRSIQGYSPEQLKAAVRKFSKGTMEGDELRFLRYKNNKGQLPFDEWFKISRGGRSGGPGHQAIQGRLEAEGMGQFGDAFTEFPVGNRVADVYWPKGPDGKPVVHQIGGINPVRGDPISRERQAIEDIRKQVGDAVDIWFWDKTGAKAQPLKNPDKRADWVPANRE